MKKVALLGGSFDPVHEGHLEMARTAKRQLGTDEVWFIPTQSTPLKDRPLTDGTHRLNMLETALQDEPDFIACGIELERPGKSYTIDTLKQLKEENPDTEFVWILGKDQALNFKQWKDWEKLFELADFAVADRDLYNQKENEVIDERFILLDMDKKDVSSSEIRQGMKLNYLDPRVLQYIVDHELYLINWIKPHLTPHRLAHSVSVARICRELAQRHHLDPHKAYIMGLFHDICKDMEPEEIKKWMDTLYSGKNTDHPAIWHAYIGAEVVDRFYGIHDPQIKNAIFNHTKGSSYDPYAMVLFIADKVDPLRGYDSSAMLEAARQDLYMGFMMVRRENKEFLQRSGMRA